MTRPAHYQVVNADSRRPTRKSLIHDPRLALTYLYRLVGANPEMDFLAVDEQFRPVAASRLRALVKEDDS